MKLFIKIIAFLIGCIFILLLVIGSNPALLDKYEHCFPNPYRYGDLYMLSNMPGYRVKNDKKVKPIFTHQNKATTLTIIGDSYTQHFDSSYFNVSDYKFIHWDALPDTIEKTDSSKKNILIIESTERYLRWRFLKNQLLTIGTKAVVSKEPEPIKLLAESNLQYMTNNYDWELSFKELKTLVHLNLFDKFSPTVGKPDKSGRLYLSETTDPANNSSSFILIPAAEVKNLVQNLNTISTDLKKMGYDEVYISIIPNAATLYKTDGLTYNQLIPRIQKDSTVRFNFIDLYKPFKEEAHSVFLFNDSHWNELGKMIWLVQVNSIIDKASKQL
ncbi:MAG TPA: hypothetical protein VFF27_11350 [Bacteroidia bacterium]|jgi:hypothetical protein|nr:hypothetical protein [Bacteroidia bacterium]